MTEPNERMNDIVQMFCPKNKLWARDDSWTPYRNYAMVMTREKAEKQMADNPEFFSGMELYTADEEPQWEKLKVRYHASWKVVPEVPGSPHRAWQRGDTDDLQEWLVGENANDYDVGTTVVVVTEMYPTNKEASDE